MIRSEQLISYNDFLNNKISYLEVFFFLFFFFSSRRRHTRYIGDWSSDVCSSDLILCITAAVSPWRDRRRRAPVPEASRAHEMPRIEAAAQIAVGDRLPGARGVDEAPAAGVDPDGVDAAPADAKKYQVPRGERRQRHRVRRALLPGRGAA